MLPFVLLTSVAVAVLLASEYRGVRPGVWLAKPLASFGFVGLAVASGALGTAYGLWVLAALWLCLLGDVLLIPRGRPRLFRLGALSFLLGHLAFVGAFVVRGLDPRVLALAAALALVPMILALRWLRPYVPEGMKATVYAYVLVISVMVVFAAGATSSGEARILLGALLFYVSDLAVARDRFVVRSLWNGAWGLPLYYAAQLLLASTVP